MKTIILNGSPKGNSDKSGSCILAKAFVSKMKESCEIRSVAKENQEELLSYIADFDRIIFITPNYIHSIPSAMLAFLHALPAARENQQLGFIIQSGYPESSESEIVSRFFKKHCERLGYDYMGTVIKGECAGLGIMPQMFDKLKEQFAEFGQLYEQTGKFDESFVKEFEKPYKLSKGTMCMLNLMKPISKCLGWNKILKQNHAYKNRYDMPYLNNR